MFAWVNRRRRRAAFAIVAALVSLLSVLTTNIDSFVEKDATIEAKARTRGMLRMFDDEEQLPEEDGESTVFENVTIEHMDPDNNVVTGKLSSESIEQNHSTSASILEDRHNVTVSETIRPPWAALCAVMHQRVDRLSLGSRLRTHFYLRFSS
jgi:hypothetical protein